MEAEAVPGKRPAPEAAPLPPPKKAMMQAQSAAPSTAHSAMSEKMLQRQNAALSSAKANIQRELDDASKQLKTAQLRLHQREECISMLDRYWANLESRLHSVIEQLDSANNGSEEVSSVVPRDTLLQKIYTGDANEQIPLDEAFRARCEATATLAEAAARALATALPLSGDEASRNLALKLSKVEAETSRLSAELALAADRVVAIERDRRDVLMRLSDSQSELERKTKDLQKAKTEILQLKGDGTSRLPVSSASAPPEAGASVSANGMLGVDKASLPSADLDKLRADIEAAAEERAAFEMAAESARKELKLAQCEVASLRAKLEEASYRPPTEEQITRTKRFLHMQREAEQGRQAAHMVERLRMDMATLQQRHAAELVHNEELHARQFEEMRTEAERMSMQLAQVSCERDAYQHRLSQHNISQRSLEERLAESERVLTLWRTEAERVLRDLHRERSRLADVEAQRDAARAESESQRQKAEGLRLELEAREQLPVDDALATAQAKCQDALVRLGGAEVAALQAKEDLAKSRKENDALVEELDSIAKAFDESQEHNVKLLKTVEAKEEAATRLMQERLRADRSNSLMLQEQAAQAERLSAADLIAEKESELRSGLEAQLKAARDAQVKTEEAHRKAMTMLEQQRRVADEAQREAAQATEELRHEQGKIQRSSEREAKSAEAAADAIAKLKNLTQERDAMERKLKRLERNAGNSTTASKGENEQLEYYKSMCKCPLCKNSNKDAIITKCGHAFCRECIDHRLELRNRKCPGCSQVFDKGYVKDLWLEYGA